LRVGKFASWSCGSIARLDPKRQADGAADICDPTCDLADDRVFSMSNVAQAANNRWRDGVRRK
jgi:hypothetical protein